MTEKDIVAFIATLYKKRYDVPAPPELLRKWSQLDDAEIEKNLNALFNHWGYTPQQGANEVNDFIEARVQTTPTEQTEFIPTAASKKKKNMFGYLILIACLLAAAYVGYQFMLYTKLNMVYCLTDNVSLRDAAGKKVGRMDLFPKQRADVNSYSKLLAVSDEPVMKKFDDIKSEILVRELFIQHDFWSFLLKKDAARAFAANAYLTRSEQEFDLFKSVFKELPKNKRENAQLNFVYRKIIVGCLRISNQLDRYITLPCDGQYSKTYDGIVRIDLADDKYQLIAQLNDDVYYHFIGNARENTFAKIRRVESNLFGLIDNNALAEDVLFKTESGSTFLYNCDGEAKGYEATRMGDDNKQIKDFEWFYSF